MADIDSEPTSARCSTNATNSASIVDREQLLDFYQQWCDKYDEVHFKSMKLRKWKFKQKIQPPKNL